MNAFQQAIGEAYGALIGVAGIEVTYHRGAAWVSLKAIEGRTTFQVDDGNGGLIDYVSRDYIFAADQLVLNGQTVEPQRGDIVKVAIGNKVYTQTVHREGSDQHWSYSDSGRTKIRVHTKLTGTAYA